VANSVAANRGRAAVDLATVAALGAGFTDAVSATGRWGRHVFTKYSASRIVAGYGLESVTVTATESIFASPVLFARAVGRTAQAVFSVSCLTNAVSTRGTRSSGAVGRAARAIFPRFTGSIVVAAEYEALGGRFVAKLSGASVGAGLANAGVAGFRSIAKHRVVAIGVALAWLEFR
jgi:hypothetical protein